jgi:hypothetical protein
MDTMVKGHAVLQPTSVQRVSHAKDRATIESRLIHRIKQLQLPFTCHVLVIPVETDDSFVINMQKVQFQGGENDWYHISTFNTVTLQHSAAWGFVSHAALSCFQSTDCGDATETPSSTSLVHDSAVSSNWIVPNDLCVFHVSSMLQFSYYQLDIEFENELATLTEQQVKDAFATRLHLYYWFSMQADSAAQARFSERQSGYDTMERMKEMVDVSSACNLIDEVVYFLCAAQLRPSSGSEREKRTTAFWLQGETYILSHKLMRYPQLSEGLLQLMGSTTDSSATATTSNCSSAGPVAAESVTTSPSAFSLQSLRLALGNVNDFHRQNLTVIQANAERIMHSIPEALATTFHRLTSEFLEVLLQRAVAQLNDKAGLRAVSRIVNPPPRSAPVDVHSRMDFRDLMDCSPACMQEIMQKTVLGGVSTQARVTVKERAILIAYLFEQKLSRKEIMHLLRPRNRLAYKYEGPEQSVEEIEKAVGRADPHKSDTLRALQHDYDRMVPRVVLECSSYIMSNGLCCHRNSESLARSQASASAAAQASLQAQNKELYVAAKRRCNQKLGEVQARRIAQAVPLSCGERVTNDWTPNPSNYTSVAFKGNGFNEADRTQTRVASTSNLVSALRYNNQVTRHSTNSTSNSIGVSATLVESHKRKNAETSMQHMEENKKHKHSVCKGQAWSDW